MKTKIQTLLTALLLWMGCSCLVSAKDIEVTSPDGKLKVTVALKDRIYYSVSGEGTPILKDCALSLDLGTETLGVNPKLRSQKKSVINERLKREIPIRQDFIENHCNVLRLNMAGNYAVEFRAYNDGVAYRFVTSKKGDIEVADECFQVNFADDCLAHISPTRSFKTSYEEPYKHLKLSEYKEADEMTYFPVLLESATGYKVLMSEADLYDYPCMFLRSTGRQGLKAVFPRCPLAFGDDGDRSVKITKEADYIARTAGTRSFPWRFFVISKQDGAIVLNNMEYILSTPCALADTDWIKPGQVSWEWWNGATPYGPDVNFVSGYNLDTYKYFIDFAAKFGIRYILMDEGWAKTTLDPYTPNPTVDLHEILRYGKEKGVGVLLWLTWLTVENHFELFKTFEEWGVAGVKIDFMDRSDQWMVNYYERVAKEAAKHHLAVDFHGSFKPAGLERKYPNVLSYEGVRGMEQMGGCKPDNSLYLPFMRNAVGPMDYTPGAMFSMQPELYRAERPNAASIGTRAYQMALYVVFESGIQMLADNPTLYYRNEECTRFITQVPTTWDETRVIDARIGEYIIVARRKGDKWFVGAICNGGQKERVFHVDLSFLQEGKTLRMTYFEDGINAAHQAMDYRKKERSVKAGDTIALKLVRNGGWTAVIE